MPKEKDPEFEDNLAEILNPGENGEQSDHTRDMVHRAAPRTPQRPTPRPKRIPAWFEVFVRTVAFIGVGALLLFFASQIANR